MCATPPSILCRFFSWSEDVHVVRTKLNLVFFQIFLLLKCIDSGYLVRVTLQGT